MGEQALAPVVPLVPRALRDGPVYDAWLEVWDRERRNRELWERERMKDASSIMPRLRLVRP
jgi:hypothetical protein